MNHYFTGKHGPLLIAEIGGNHEGNFDYAKRLTQLAIESDVDYVKFQIYTGDTLVSSLESPTRNAHFKKFELTIDQHKHLASMVREAGLRYTSSVWDETAFAWIDSFVSVYKIGSGDLTAYPLLKATAALKKPIIISTGLATEAEVLASVAYLQSVDELYKQSDHLAVLQCTSMYPIPAYAANLNVIRRLKEATGLTVGYSDHTEGSKALHYAYAMGAEILEFHFTDTREGKQFRDHKVSLTPEEIRTLIDELKLIDELQGSKEKKPEPIEIENGHVESFRRAVYPSRDVAAGELLSFENTTTLRPNHGIDARYFSQVIGKRAKTSLRKHQKLEWDLLET